MKNTILFSKSLLGFAKNSQNGKNGGGKTYQNQLVSKYCRQHYWRVNLTFVFVVILGMGSSNQMFAQFLPPVIPNVSSGLSITPWNLNNDIIDIGSDSYGITTYSVPSSVSASGIAWNATVSSVTYTNSTPFSIYTDVNDIYFPDVCLIYDASNNELHAVAAYYVYFSTSTYAFQVEDFLWNGTAFISNGVTTLESGSGSNQGHSVNIDSDDDGNFVIVYDNGDYEVKAAAGSVNGGFNIIIYPYVWAPDSKMPDVCIGNNNGNRYVCVSRIDVNSGDLFVDDADLGSFQAAGVYTSTTYLNPTFGLLYFPRIAAPNYTTLGNDFTVVVEEDDHLNFVIYGINVVSTSPSVYVYNDGSIITGTGTNLTSIENLLPVVAYNADQKVWVGWNVNNLSGNISGGSNSAIAANFSVALFCDEYADPISTEYWVVPDNLSNGDEYMYLALSSRHSASTTDLYLSYNNYSPYNELLTKRVTPGIGSLREKKPISESNTSINNFLLSIDQEQELFISIYDVNGRLILSDNANAIKVKEIIDDKSKLNSQSIYLVKLATLDNQAVFSGKLFIN
jgi:hypothetical protein